MCQNYNKRLLSCAVFYDFKYIYLDFHDGYMS